jgi:hypothetical protein
MNEVKKSTHGKKLSKERDKKGVIGNENLNKFNKKLNGEHHQ